MFLEEEKLVKNKTIEGNTEKIFFDVTFIPRTLEVVKFISIIEKKKVEWKEKSQYLPWVYSFLPLHLTFFHLQEESFFWLF